MIHYKELGLVNTNSLFKKAMEGRYAIPAYNFNNLEQLQAIVTACSQTRSPVILQISKGARKYANQTMLIHMARGAVEMAKQISDPAVPIVLHLDHGDSYELCVSCIESGFSSVMIDGSHLPYDENIEMTRKVADFAANHNVSVEGELGVLAGIEEHVKHEQSLYTKPEEVEDFVTRTSVDSLAISIGTSHGAYKFPPDADIPPLRFDILEEVEKRLPGFPIVLHGASSVIPKYVEMINAHGGSLSGARGVPEEQLRRAATSAVCKVNIDSDGRLAMTAMIRKMLTDNPKNFDPRKYLGPARDELIELIKHKNEAVLGSAGKA
ncbi:MAG: class II fructose-1,6-bisphosphate aldolase [Deltaproteobacteria bacterium]|nr:class II fructose-1,6-bisphosphate aldolase [Deltaproteobacteria bacterium]